MIIFRVYSYEDLQRYPDVYEGAQIEIGAVVEKIIKSTDNEYELLVKQQVLSVWRIGVLMLITG